MFHGFLRHKDGTFTTFDAPGVGTGFEQGTSPISINFRGEITGQYVDGNNALHGFLRKPDHREGARDEKDDENDEDSQHSE